MSRLQTFAVVLSTAAIAGPHMRAQQPPPIRVTIDIKPGDTPTTIEPGRQGVIPIAILTTPQFDAATTLEEPCELRVTVRVPVVVPIIKYEHVGLAELLACSQAPLTPQTIHALGLRFFAVRDTAG